MRKKLGEKASFTNLRVFTRYTVLYGIKAGFSNVEAKHQSFGTDSLVVFFCEKEVRKQTNKKSLSPETVGPS